LDQGVTQYDALLVVGFGGPEGPDDVLPFLRNVTAGRDIPDARLREVGRHYQHFGGVSPINAQNRALVAAVQEEIAERGLLLPVYWGNRNWHPYLRDTIASMRADGIQRAIAFFTSAYSSYSGCRQYRENLAAALADNGADDMVVDRVGPYYNHSGFVEPFVDATVLALEELPVTRRAHAHIVFTTHSLPMQLAQTSGDGSVDGGAYVAQHRQVAEWVASAVARRTGVVRPWSLVFQSRSGPPTQAWLEPDVSDHLDALSQQGTSAVVFVPIGFVSDHIEVLWDIDVQASSHAEDLGIAYARASTPGTDARFVAMVADLVAERRNDVAVPLRPRVNATAAAPDRCAAGCCPNPRGPVPAAAGDD
jgi:protoporphyrin/coproporphyrin ferrochelatase